MARQSANINGQAKGSNSEGGVREESVLLSPSSGPAFLPSNLSGLVLWLDGTDPLATGTPPAGGTAVSQWTDKSTSANNFVQATGANQPTYQSGAVNSKGSIRFVQASNSFMTSPTQFINPAAGFDFFYFISPVTVSGLANFFYNDKITNPPTIGINSTEMLFVGVNTFTSGMYPHTFTSATNYLIEWQYNGSGTGTSGNFIFNVNNSQLTYATSDGGSSNNNTTCLGSFGSGGGGTAFDGYICEVVYYSRVLTSTERTNLQNYFEAKWTY